MPMLLTTAPDGPSLACEQAPPTDRGVPPDASRVELGVVSTTIAFDALRSEWLSLHREAGASVFQSFEWQRAWWKHFRESVAHAELHIVVLRAEGRLVGVAPFFIERRPFVRVLQLCRLAFIGERTSDYLDVVCAPGWEHACVQRIAAHLVTLWPRLDLIDLTDIPDRSVVHRELAATLTAAGLPVRRRVGAQCPRAALKETWEATLAGLVGEHRRHLNKRMRQLRERFSVELVLTEREERLTADLVDFIAMHQNRMASLGKAGVFTDPRAERFHLELAPQFLRRGWLFLAFLLLDGRRVAAVYSFSHGGELAFYLGGMDNIDSAYKYSPGLVLHCLCAEEAIRRGIRCYDFLRGAEPYKHEFGAVDSPNWHIAVAGRRMRLMRWRERIRRRIVHEGDLLAERRRTARSVAAAFASYGLQRAWAVASRTLRWQYRPS